MTDSEGTDKNSTDFFLSSFCRDLKIPCGGVYVISFTPTSSRQTESTGIPMRPFPIWGGWLRGVITYRTRVHLTDLKRKTKQWSGQRNVQYSDLITGGILWGCFINESHQVSSDQPVGQPFNQPTSLRAIYFLLVFDCEYHTHWIKSPKTTATAAAAAAAPPPGPTTTTTTTRLIYCLNS